MSLVRGSEGGGVALSAHVWPGALRQVQGHRALWWPQEEVVGGHRAHCSLESGPSG